MNIKEFWQNEREEKKRKKLLAKESKKKILTPEQKLTRIMSIIFLIVVVLGAFYSCSKVFGGGVDLKDAIYNVSEETKTAIQKTVDTNLLFLNGRYSQDDKDKCFEKLKESGNKTVQTFDDIDEDYKINTDVIMENNALRGLVGNLFSDSKDIVLCEFQIYAINGEYFEKSIVHLMFDDIDYFGVDGVYVTTISSVEILDNSITALDSYAIVNNLDGETNEKVIEELNEYMELVESITTTNTDDYSLNKIMNYYINSSINLFATAINSKTIELTNNGLKFIAQ